jgi:hypothetical protein
MTTHLDKTFSDLGRREINLRHYKVEEVLPDHIVENYPTFVKLLKAYYSFEDQESSPTNLLNELFLTKDITQTDIDLLSFVEDELLLGQSYFEGFPDKREAAKYSNTLYKSKGTKYSIQQFFRTFFNIDPDVVYTKKNVFNLNESEIGSSSQRYLTDDKLYQTYAIQIKSELSISEWRNIYKLFVHPAGMYLGSQVQLEGVVDLDIENQPFPGTLDIPPQEVEGIATMRHPEGYAQHTALFDYFDTNIGGGTNMKFRMNLGSTTTYPNPGGNDMKDVADKSIGELHNLYQTMTEYLEPNSPTFDIDHNADSSGIGLSSLETIDQEQFTWRNVEREDTNNPAVGITGDSDSEITLDELL